jgi:Fe-S oxidoreductase/FAD/FMN-containing dehydrogenase
MADLDSARRSSLERLFGSRSSFDETERALYSHDIAAMPSLVAPLIGRAVADAVVQPETEAEVVALVQWATEHRVPLTPRAKATSGYGGVIPVHQGVVVDLSRMKHITEIDGEALTVTVEPAVVWEALDAALARRGLTLRLYPTSYPSSTVGGWLAQGGAGIGSYEAGWFRDNVVRARVVLPSGEIREMSGDDLALVSDAEGITGIITHLTVRVQPVEPLQATAIACPSPAVLQQVIQGLVDANLPLWSLAFINPTMAELRNRAPLMEHWGHPVGQRVVLPAQYVLLLTGRVRERAAVARGLAPLLAATGASALDQRIADHEWETRFKLMTVKRLGPSLVPSEVVVPLTGLASVLDEIASKIRQPLVMEAVAVRGARPTAEIVMLGFIPGDQRTLGYNFVFGLALTMIRIAERHGGRAYSTGLYFASKAGAVLGAERLDRLRDFKHQVDPDGLMNPGKVLGNGVLGVAMRAAAVAEPLVRTLGNAVPTRIGERLPPAPVRGIPADVVWYAYACSQCGYCVDECDQFYGRGWESQSPRGKWFWLREFVEGRRDWNQKMVDSFLACTTCELCVRRCSASLPIEPSWMKLRGRLITDEHRMTFPPFEMMAEALDAEGDIWAGYRKDRSAWFPADLVAAHGPGHTSSNVYFAGCTASYCEKDIGIASVRLLDHAGVDFTYLGEEESCCATPMLVAGKWDLFAATMKRNITAVKNAGGDTVLTSCPACDMMWRHVYPEWARKLGIAYDITARHYSEVLAERIVAGTFTFPATGHTTPETVTWHDSCHIGRASGVYEPPRELIKAVPNTTLVEMDHNREAAHCCGSVLTLIKDPAVAADVGGVRLEEALDTGARKVLALCPCCEFQLRVSRDTKQLPIEVVDLAHFAAAALGYQLPDPHPEARAQWATFEAMIPLMTPQGFANLMKTMWPEMVAAMPFGMGRMLTAAGHVAGALEAMKPLFPVLFPRLLPMMLPRVMPALLDRVAARVPMPAYMAEQMPTLLPRVMNNLMPHMIRDVVPLVSDSLIGYLHDAKPG